MATRPSPPAAHDQVSIPPIVPSFWIPECTPMARGLPPNHANSGEPDAPDASSASFSIWVVSYCHPPTLMSSPSSSSRTLIPRWTVNAHLLMS